MSRIFASMTISKRDAFLEALCSCAAKRMRQGHWPRLFSWPILLLVVLLALRSLVVAQGISEISAIDDAINVRLDSSNSGELQLVVLEAFDSYQAVRDWLTDDWGGVLSTATHDVLTMTFEPGNVGFDPKLVNVRPVQADYVNQFSARMRMRGYTGIGEVPFSIYVLDGLGGFASCNFTLPADNQFHTVRVEISQQTLTGAIDWTGERYLRIDPAEGAVYADYASAVLEIDWIAVTDDPLFNGGRNYTSYDRFWDLGYPVPVWTGTVTGSTVIGLDRQAGGMDRLFSKFQLADTDFNAIGNPKWVTDLSGLSYVTEDNEGWVAGSGDGAGPVSVNNGVLSMDFTSASPFDPYLVNSLNVLDADAVGEFAMRVRLLDYGGVEDSVSGAIYCFPYDDPGASPFAFTNIEVDTSGDWQLVRVDLASALGADWANLRTLRLDIPEVWSGMADFFSARVEIDWIAVTDDPNFEYGDSIEAPGILWDFSVDRNFSLPPTLGKKGVDGLRIEDHLALGTKVNKQNFVMSRLLDPTGNRPEKVSVNGLNVSYRPEVIREFGLGSRPLTQAGMVLFNVVLNILPSAPVPGDPLVDIRSEPGSNPQDLHLGGFNLSDPVGVAHFIAAMRLMASACSYPDGRNGIVSNFIIGNELDQHWVWHNLGEINEDGVAENYALALRLADLAVRSVHPEQRVYTSFTNHWDHYSGGNPLRATKTKTLLYNINDRIRAEGDFPWQMSFHPYPQNLLDPEFWFDTDADFNMDTKFITFENLEVLAQALWLSELRYNGAELRNIALSEQGFNTLQNADGEDIQAAALAYSWHKIKQIDGIGHYMYHRDIDHAGETALGMYFGLWTRDESATTVPNLPLAKKPSWFVFRDADTPNWEATFNPYLSRLPFSNWEDADPRAGSPDFTFENDGDLEGWQPANLIAAPGLSVGGGVLECVSAGGDPFLTTRDCYFVTEFRERIRIRMAVNGGTDGELFWRHVASNGFSADKSAAFNLNTDGEFHIYELDLSSDPDWVGQEILGLRLDPTTTSGAIIRVDYILAGAAGSDFDMDGVADSEEAPGDADGDGRPNFADTDSDNDGYSDSEEVLAGSNPYNPLSIPGSPDTSSKDHWVLY